MNGSVRLPVCLSVITFWLCSHHYIFRNYYQWQKWCTYERTRSKVKVTLVITPLSRFRTVTPVGIHIWWWNDASSSMLQGHTANKIVEFDPNWEFPDCNSSLNSPMATKLCTNLKWHRRGALSFFKVIRQISRSLGTKKIADFDPNVSFPDCTFSFNSLMATKWCITLETT